MESSSEIFEMVTFLLASESTVILPSSDHALFRSPVLTMASAARRIFILLAVKLSVIISKEFFSFCFGRNTSAR